MDDRVCNDARAGSWQPGSARLTDCAGDHLELDSVILAGIAQLVHHGAALPELWQLLQRRIADLRTHSISGT